MSSGDKVRENRLRRAAKRQGLELIKSRRRDPWAPDYGLWVLVAPGYDAAHLFATGRGQAIDEIEAALPGAGVYQRPTQ